MKGTLHVSRTITWGRGDWVLFTRFKMSTGLKFRDWHESVYDWPEFKVGDR